MFTRRLPLPAPRELAWPLKLLESAQTSLTYDEFGRMVMRIQHDVLKGISPGMVAWWFGHIGGEMEGKRLNRYLVWHQDHTGSLPKRSQTGGRAPEPNFASSRRSAETPISTLMSLRRLRARTRPA
jgi:hypothetical protein